MIYLILILALFLRLPLLDASFWLDEAAQFLESVRPLSQQLEIKQDFQPPLMHLITFVGIRLGELVGLGTSEWWVRLLPSLLPGMVTIFVTYKLGLSLKLTKKTAALASLLLATSSLHVFYSQELRPYSLPAMWALLATWQMVEITQAKKWAKHLFVLFSIAGIYSSYLYPFLLLGQTLFLFKEKIAPRTIFGLFGLVALSFLPWLPKFFEQLSVGQALRQSMPGWESVVSLPQFKTALLVPLKFVFGVSDLEANVGYMILILAVFIPLIYLSYVAYRKERKNLTFFACLLLLPLVAAWLFSFFIPVLQAKRVLFLLPFFSLFAAKLIVSYREHALSKILFSSLLIINIFSNFAYWTKPNLQREDWRGLQQEISRKFPVGDTAVVFGFDEPFAPWRLYDRNQFKTVSSGVFYSRELTNPAETFKELSNYRYVLLFDYLRDLTDPDDILVQAILDLGFRETGVLDYPNIGFIRIYSQENLAYLSHL